MATIEFIPVDENQRWDSIVTGFPNYDVYYLNGYVRGFQLHGDGEPFLLYYHTKALRAIYVFMRRHTAIDGLYDAITPYGYGGVLFDGDTTEDNLRDFYSDYVTAMRGMHVVCNFVRYHPVLRNADPMRSLSTVVDLGETIVMELQSEEVIWDNITSKHRNMIRKASKNGVSIHHAKDPALFENFRQIYNATMDSDEADEYYYFKPEFYESIQRDLLGHCEMFYAVCDEKIVAMSIMLFANGRLNYHLSGSDYEYRRVAPSNLLLYEAALWGCHQGMKTFHLGGGVGSGQDGLYKFKAGFNRNSDCRFSIGKEIFDQKGYDQLVEVCRQARDDFDPNSTFFPVYRQ